MRKSIKKIAVTGAAGQIAYSLLFRIASGELFGKDQPIELRLLEIPMALQSLEGVGMELLDCAFPLLKGIQISDDPYFIFKDVTLALLVGSKPRGPGMERKDLLSENAKIFIEQGKALNGQAAPDVRVLVVGNPCNTNALIAMHNAPNINKNHFFSMTRLDENRGKALIAQKANVDVVDVKKMVIWGNHSATQVPDFTHVKIQGKPLMEFIPDRHWLETSFVQRVQQRGAEIIATRGKSSAASAANAIIDTIHSLYNPTPQDEWTSVAIHSNGNPYGVASDLFFSFPCRSKGNGEVEIVPGVDLNDFMKKKIALTEKELLEEREAVKNLL